MAITVDWPTGVISVQKADMVLIQSVPSEIYQLDMDAFRLTLKGLEDDGTSIGGMSWSDTHAHSPPVTISGAVLARVVEILDPYTVTFEDDQYRVQVVGANTNIGEKTNVNQVSVSTSNSAGLQDLNSLQAASFNGVVAVKPSSIYSGTVFPVGTRQTPVNNFDDAVAIASSRGINEIVVLESTTIANTDVSGFKLVTDNPEIVILTIDTTADVTDCVFGNVQIQGVMDGRCIIRNSIINNLWFTNGLIEDSYLTATLSLGGPEDTHLINLASLVPGGQAFSYPFLDFASYTGDVAVRDYSGGLRVINSTNAGGNSSLDIDSGRVIFDATNTAGSFSVRGIADVVDDSAGATVSDETMNKLVRDIGGDDPTLAIAEILQFLKARMDINPVGGLMTLRRTDGEADQAAQAYLDVAGTQPYDGSGPVSRRDSFS